MRLLLCLVSGVLIGGLSASAGTVEQAIRDHLERAGTPLVKSVSKGVDYELSYACSSTVPDCRTNLPLGTTFNVYLSGRYFLGNAKPPSHMSLLVYDSNRLTIIDDALLAWRGSTRALVAIPMFGKFQATFKNLFLREHLPDGARLIMLGESGSGHFTYRSVAISSAASGRVLSAPITVSTFQWSNSLPRALWTLDARLRDNDYFLRWYVTDMASGEIIDASGIVVSGPRPVKILSSADPKWASASSVCHMLAVYIDNNYIGQLEEIYAAPTVVAAKFGDC